MGVLLSTHLDWISRYGNHENQVWDNFLINCCWYVVNDVKGAVVSCECNDEDDEGCDDDDGDSKCKSHDDDDLMKSSIDSYTIFSSLIVTHGSVWDYLCKCHVHQVKPA